MNVVNIGVCDYASTLHYEALGTGCIFKNEARATPSKFMGIRCDELAKRYKYMNM
jgi:hypothetical protein